MRSLLLLVAVAVLSPVEPFPTLRGNQHHKKHGEMVPNEEPCHFPFRYRREMHHSCVPGSIAGPQPWCATTENFDRDQQWRYCEKEQRPRGHCDPNPCRNGANCEARRSGFHCSCNPGFYGKHCEKESCFESPGRLHIGEKETWLRFQPAGLEECHCTGKKKMGCKPVHGRACADNPCLNGGHCIVLKQDWVCSCPGRFSGPLCDIDHSHTCYSGNGHLYRGMAQSTLSGEPCLPWDSPILFHEFSSNTVNNAVSLGLGAHAFCRNPDNDSQPWCYVLQGKQLTWGFCNVTHCHPHTNNSETTMNVGQDMEPVTESPVRTNGTQSGAGSVPGCGQRYTKTSSQRSRVVGGMVALSDAHPYMAAMYVGEQFCGGSLIASCWVLTAAHCLERRPDVSQISVVLGQALYNITTKGSMKFQVQAYQLHENYSEINKHHDIALVQLKENVPGHCAEFSHSISPVCLPGSMEIYDGNRCQTAGWGHLYEGADKLSVYLQEADVPIIPHEQCQSREVHGTRVTSKMLCAGYLDGRSDACQGDSGGPLVCDEQNSAILRGIVSWGTGCAQKNKPGVYTNVAHYLNWIQSKMH
ncbi:coagulation factor XII isoform X2 [Eublepharis macularius]|uniref:Coagulation factor XII isoform X2 n=1 Tax=Eublepharis macularius TaxID=481883 RepID=A0AA97JAX3_EUBMA|nr:coagulation factor XII isoform X2 [Eublepharis macularius]